MNYTKNNLPTYLNKEKALSVKGSERVRKKINYLPDIT